MSETNQSESAKTVGSNVGLGAVVDFIKVKLAEAERSVKCREQGEACFRGGTDSDWKSAANMHSSTRGRAMSKAQRMAAANAEKRIAVKCRREVELFKATLEMLQAPNADYATASRISKP